MRIQPPPNMKTKSCLSVFLLLCSTFVYQICLAQGSLTPAGAPGPTMKSLDQIEPRTPVDSVHTPGSGTEQFIISQSGSYYLTTNITGVSGKDGIRITASAVNLDLNGFTMQGVSGSGYGIYSSGDNVVVRNGRIQNWNSGINDTVSSTQNRIYESVTVCSNNSFGIVTATGAIIRNCLVQNNGYFGIYASGASRITGCVVNGNGAGGIAIEPPGGCVIENNFAFGNNTANTYGDIYMSSANNYVENNRVIVTSATGYGIYIYPISANTNNVIVKNNVSGSGSRNYNLQPNNDVGPIGSATNAVSPWANVSH